MNRFYTYSTTLVPQTLAKSADLNADFSTVQNSFDAAQGEINCALRVDAGESALNLARLPVTATRASKLMVFDSLGNPTSTMQLPADLDANAHRVKNLPTPTLSGDAAEFSWVQSYVAAYLIAGSGSSLKIPYANVTGSGANAETLFFSSFN